MCQLAHAQAVSPRRLLEVADIGQPVVSPAGDYVAFRVEQASVERNTYDTVWYVQPLDGSAPARRVADGGVPLRDSAGVSLPAEAVWAPDGRWIYYRALVDGRIDVWRAAADGSGAVPVTRDAANVQTFRLGRGGTILEYAVGARREDVLDAEREEYDQGTRVDGSVPLGQGFFRSGYVDGRLATQRFGEVWFNRAGLLEDVPWRWKTVGLDGRPAERETRPQGATAASAPSEGAWEIARDPRGGRAAVLHRTGERNGLRDRPDVELTVRWDGKQGRTVRCTHVLCTGQAITAIQWRTAMDEVMFTVTDPGEGLAQSIYRWDVGTGVVRPVVRTDGLVNGGRDQSSQCGLSAQALACVVASAGVPPRLERIDIESGERHVLFDPNAALAHDMGQVRVRLLKWQGAHGERFSGQYFPAAVQDTSGRPPLFVTYYRCAGFLRGGVGDEWPLASLAQHGIAALCINAAPRRTDASERYRAGVSAVEGAIAFLSEQDGIDPDKVGYGGLSFGSEVAMWLATRTELLAAVSASSPVITPNYYLFNLLKGDAFHAGLQAYWQLEAPSQTPGRWNEISPLPRLDRISAPILFQMSEQEFSHSIDYVVPLVEAKKADAWVFPHEPHQKFQPRHKLAAYERNVNWFRFWLQGSEDEVTGKAALYGSWREMRDAASARP